MASHYSESKLVQTFTEHGARGTPSGFEAAFHKNFGDVNALICRRGDSIFAFFQASGAADWRYQTVDWEPPTRLQFLVLGNGWTDGEPTILIGEVVEIVGGFLVVQQISYVDDEDRPFQLDTVANVSTGSLQDDSSITTFRVVRNGHVAQYYLGYGDKLAFAHHDDAEPPDPAEALTVATATNDTSFPVAAPCSPYGGPAFVTLKPARDDTCNPPRFYAPTSRTANNYLGEPIDSSVAEALKLQFITYETCCTRTVLPCIHLFAIDSEEHQIHWLAQTDGKMSAACPPVFAAWRVLVTTPEGAGRRFGSYPKFADIAPVVLGTTSIVLFARDIAGKPWVLRYLGEQRYWEPASEIVFPHVITKMVAGVTPDGAPQLFVEATEANSESSSIWCIREIDDVWASEKLEGEEI